MNGAAARALALLAASVLLTAGCRDEPPAPEPAPPLPAPVERDLPDLEEAGALTMVTMTNSTSYLIYRGEVMGYEYELLRAFCDEHGLDLEVRVAEQRTELLRLLNRGEGDVVAARLTATGELAARTALTPPLYETEPVVVQREASAAGSGMPAAAKRLLADNELEVEARLVERPAQLAGREVHVPRAAGYVERLVEVADEISGEIEIIELSASHEALIRRVADGEITLAASPANLARLKESYFTNIVVEPTLGEPLPVVWAVRSNASALHRELSDWVREQRGGRLFSDMYYRYFVDRRGYRERIASDYLTTETARLSEFDDLFRRYARELGWDWRLLASVAYQESRFRPSARSWAGAQGLFQLMPRTARRFGVRDRSDPDQSAAGAVKFLAWLEEYWADKIPDGDERIRFVLASYNVGQGHVQDARRLTRKYGGDPNRWDDVSYWLMQKSKRKYYTDPVVHYGFARGLEPVTYVDRTLDRLAHYRDFVS
jgi:membrane-bound lytic murein transglycosylase F